MIHQWQRLGRRRNLTFITKRTYSKDYHPIIPVSNIPTTFAMNPSFFKIIRVPNSSPYVQLPQDFYVKYLKNQMTKDLQGAFCHEPNSEGPSSAWKAYMNARVAGLFLLVLLEYPNSKGVVRATSRDSIWHYTDRELGPLS
nr:hypothetical protein [Tanacetum cinerariifolium]